MPSASKIVLQSMPLEFYVALRWTLSAAVFCVLMGWKKQFVSLKVSENLKIALLGVFGYTIASYGTLGGLQLGGVTFFALLSLSSPFLIVALSLFKFREKFSYRLGIALLLAIGGIAITMKGKSLTLDFTTVVKASFFILGAYTLEGLVFLKSGELKSRVPLLHYLFVAQLGAAVVAWLIVVAKGGAVSIQDIHWHSWLAALYVTLFACVFCYLCWYWLLNYLPGKSLAFFQYIEGIFAAFLGVLLFQEQMPFTMLMASVLFLLSIVFALEPQKSED